jgi:UDP-glucose 4-epimerase
LVTGGAGFIGSHLCEALLASDFTVRCYDDLSHGSRDFVDKHIKNRHFEFYLEDVCDRRTLATVVDGASLVFHLAARKIPRYGDALATLNVNNEGTRNVLELADRQNTRVILASTSDVYGKGTPPFKETDDLIIGPSHIRRWSYAASKIFDEHLALAHHAEHGLPVVVLRFFGTYGPRNHRSWWGGPQSVFIEQALKNEEITIHGDGTQTRSFTYIEDLIDGIMRASASESAIGQIINLGSDEEISINALARLICGLIRPNATPKLKFISYESFGGGYEDVTRRLPDLARARELLGYAWKMPLVDGLAKTILWHREVETN